MDLLLFIVLLLAFLAARNHYQVYRLSRRYTDAVSARGSASGNANA